jgi:hypothetical protein
MAIDEKIRDASATIEMLGAKYPVLARLASGIFEAADLGELATACEDLKLSPLAGAVHRINRGEDPRSVFAYLIGTGDFPELLDLARDFSSALSDLNELRRAHATLRGRK